MGCRGPAYLCVLLTEPQLLSPRPCVARLWGGCWYLAIHSEEATAREDSSLVSVPERVWPWPGADPGFLGL